MVRPAFGGELKNGTVLSVEGGGTRALGDPPNEPAKDWAILVRRTSPPEDAPDSGPAFTEETKVLVKLRTPVRSASRVGDVVTGRPAGVEDGAIVWQGHELHLDEGAELNLRAIPHP